MGTPSPIAEPPPDGVVSPAVPAPSPYRLLDVDGTLLGDSPLPVDRVADLFRRMVAARTYDKKATAMQKQGRLATYAPVPRPGGGADGSTAALEPRWTGWSATYRDAAAMWDSRLPVV